jgi:hypothetical protein
MSVPLVPRSLTIDAMAPIWNKSSRSIHDTMPWPCRSHSFVSNWYTSPFQSVKIYRQGFAPFWRLSISRDALLPWVSSRLAITPMPNCETLVIDFDVLIIFNPFKVVVFDDIWCECQCLGCLAIRTPLAPAICQRQPQ